MNRWQDDDFEDDEEDDADYEVDDGGPVFYIPRRVMNWIIIAALIALLAYEFYGLFVHPHTPVPVLPTPPLSRI